MRILIASLLLISLPAVADPAAKALPQDAKQMHSDDCAKARAAKRACVIDMTGEEVGGTSPTANGIATTVIRFPPNASLIRLRHEFIEQIVKTAEDL
jgi:hypothetical protein